MNQNTPLRIVHCFRSPVGGIFRHVRDLAMEHSRAGHKVGIVCDNITGTSFEDKLFDDIRPYLELGLIRLPIDRSIGLSDLGVLKDSYNGIKSLQPDVLHGHGAKGGAIARLVGSLLRVNRYRVARLYSPHGGSLHFSPGLKGKAVFALERTLERMSDATVFVCEFERDAYIRKIGHPRKRHEVIYNGVGASEFEPLTLAGDAADFQYVGMLRDLKGADIFVQAFGEAERIVGRPLSALMIGDGPDQQKYANMMVELGLGRRIRMMPSMTQRNAFSLAKTLVVPSRAEAMPYIVLEAVAAGKCVIASRVGGIPEALGRSNRALVEPGDWKALGQAMAASINDPSWAVSSQPDMAYFSETFCSGTMGRRMLQLYTSILQNLR